MRQNKPARAAGSVLKRAQQAATAFLIVTLPLLLYLPNSEYGYTKTIYAFLMVSALYALWGVRAWRAGSWTVRWPALSWAALGLLGAGALSLVNATSAGIVLQSLAVLLYFALFYLVIANTAEDPFTVALYLGAALAAAALAAGYGLLQYIGALPGLPGTTGGTHAMISAMGNKNFLAEFLTLWLLPGLFLLLELRRAWAKVLLLGIAALGYAAIQGADSNGALMGLLAGGLVWAAGLLAWRKTLWPALRRQWGWIAAWVLVLIAVFAAVDKPTALQMLWSEAPAATAVSPATHKPLAALQNPIQPLQDLLERMWRAGSGNTRSWDWWVAVEMLADHPLFGVGLGHYKVRFVDYKTRFLQTERGQNYDFTILRAAQAHNDYLQAAAEMGLAGIAALVFALGTLGWRTVRQLRRLTGRRQLAVLALAAGGIAFLADAAVNFPAHLAASAFGFALLLGIAHGPHLDAPLGRTRLRRRGLTLALGGCLVASLAVCTLAYRDWRANIDLDTGNAYLQRGLYQLAREAYEDSLAWDFQPAEVLFRLGALYQALGDADQAEHFLERSLNSFLVEEAFLPLAAIKLNKQAYDEADALLDRLLGTHPRDELLQEAELLKAVVLVRRGEVEAGAAQLLALKARYPDFEKVDYSLGEAALAAGRPGEALGHFRRSLETVIAKQGQTQRRIETLQARGGTAADVARLQSSLNRYNQLHEEIQQAIDELSASLR